MKRLIGLFLVLFALSVGCSGIQRSSLPDQRIRYTVTCSEKSAELDQIVESYSVLGYFPQGGISVLMDREAKLVYCQALVKKR